MNCKVLLADQHEICRAGLKSLLQGLNGLTVCSEAGDGRETLLQAKQFNPDILMANLKLPKANGLVIARRLLKIGSRLKLLIIVETISMNVIRDLLQAGVQGIVSKADPASDIVDAIEALRHNRTYFPRYVERAILEGYLHPKAHRQSIGDLTVREHEILQQLAEGATTKDIAIVLGISVKTAETHRHRLMEKLKLHNIAQLTLYAVSHDIVDAPILPQFVPFEVPTPIVGLPRHRQRPKVLPTIPLTAPYSKGTALHSGT